MNIREKFLHKGLTVKLIHDEDCASPRENDNLGTMVCWHRRYTLGDVQPTEDPETYLETLKADYGELPIVLPLYLYDHSGITMRTSSFSCPWDSGQVGFIYVTAAKLKAEYGDAPDAIERATKYLIGEVEEYASFIEGDCYGYIVEDPDGEQLDSCWGFIGFDYAKQEAIEAADWLAGKREAERELKRDEADNA